MRCSMLDSQVGKDCPFGEKGTNHCFVSTKQLLSWGDYIQVFTKWLQSTILFLGTESLRSCGNPIARAFTSPPCAYQGPSIHHQQSLSGWGQVESTSCVVCPNRVERQEWPAGKLAQRPESVVKALSATRLFDHLLIWCASNYIQHCPLEGNSSANTPETDRESLTVLKLRRAQLIQLHL